MHEMHLMKGQGKPFFTVISEQYVLTLLKYADGSHGICGDGMLIGVWEPPEIKDCLKSFIKLVQRREMSSPGPVRLGQTNPAFSRN